MKTNINLLSTDTSEGERKKRLGRIRTLSFTALIIVAILSVLVFLIDFRFSASYVIGQQNKLIAELSSQEEKASKIFLLNNRLSNISAILDQRTKFHETSEKITANLPSAVSIQSFAISGGAVTLEVSSNSLLELNQFLNQMIALSQEKVFNRVTLNSLVTDSQTYTMKISAN